MTNIKLHKIQNADFVSKTTNGTLNPGSIYFVEGDYVNRINVATSKYNYAKFGPKE